MIVLCMLAIFEASSFVSWLTEPDEVLITSLKDLIVAMIGFLGCQSDILLVACLCHIHYIHLEASITVGYTTIDLLFFQEMHRVFFNIRSFA